jgi:hypothetical protein
MHTTSLFTLSLACKGAVWPVIFWMRLASIHLPFDQSVEGLGGTERIPHGPIAQQHWVVRKRREMRREMRREEGGH